ncbi:MAG: hypothetical protein ABI443_11560 [Chthoniobacterales bacterium]
MKTDNFVKWGLILLGLAMCVPLRAADEEMPFGDVADADYARFAEFAKKVNFDVRGDMEKICKGDHEALARLFKFSLNIKSLDENATAYRQIVYSTMLNIGEVIPPETYLKILNGQSPEVRQRVKDFLYYPFLELPSERRKQVEADTTRDLPTLFPKGYQFAHNDALFANLPKSGAVQ